LLVDKQRRGRTPADAAAVVLEGYTHDVIARWQRLSSLNLPFIFRLIGTGIGKERLSLQQQQSPTSKSATDGSYHTFGASLGEVHLGGDGPRLVLEVWCGPLRDSLHSRVEDKFASTPGETGADGRVGSTPEAGIERVHVVFLRLDVERRLQLLELIWIFCRQIVCLAEVLVDVVELPLEIVGVRLTSQYHPRQTQRCGAGHPTVLIDRPVTHQFKVLCGVSGWRLGVIKRIDEAYAVERFLRGTI